MSNDHPLKNLRFNPETRRMEIDYDKFDPQHRRALLDAAENIVIAINMGWDLGGVIERMQKAINDGMGRR